MKNMCKCKKVNINKKAKDFEDKIANQTYSTRDVITTRVSGYNSLPTWDSDYYCGVDAAAILFAYYDDEEDDDFVPTNVDYNEDLQEYIVDEGYLEDKGLTTLELQEGLDNYVDDHVWFWVRA